MKKPIILIMLIIISLFAFSSCGGTESPNETANPNQTETPQEQEEDMKDLSIVISIGSQKFEATLTDSQTSKELIKLLPLSIEMSELNGNEKYHYLQTDLPTDARRVENIQKGDIMLFGSNCIVFFYESFSTPYSYTRLGTAAAAENFSSALKTAGNSVSVTITKQ